MEYGTGDKDKKQSSRSFTAAIEMVGQISLRPDAIKFYNRISSATCRWKKITMEGRFWMLMDTSVAVSRPKKKPLTTRESWSFACCDFR